MTGTEARGPTAVVFDCDGLLADTAAVWESAFVDAASVLPLTLRASQLAALQGRSVPAAARALASWSSRPGSAPRLQRILHDRLRRRLATAPPPAMPGALDLVARLHGLRRLAVSSNAPRDVLHATLEATGLLTFMDLVVSADDVAAPKPAPDVYRTACVRLGVDAADAVAVEDTALGAAAAIAAGLPTVLVAPDQAKPDGPFPSAVGAVALRVPALHDARLTTLVLSGAGAPARAIGT